MYSIPLKWRLYSAYSYRCGLRAMRNRKDAGKVFCVGLNKTGTTSWTAAMADLGYVVGNERAAEILFDDWVEGNHSRIIKFCATGEVFQDVPFSLPGSFRVLDQAFPGSKFVLTVRDSAEQWYDSVTSFHAKIWSRTGRCPPSAMDLAEADYIYRGWPARFCREVFKTPTEAPYERSRLLEFYKGYNREVVEYFAERPERFLKVNVAKKGAFKKLCGFLGQPYSGGEFPWKNKT